MNRHKQDYFLTNCLIKKKFNKSELFNSSAKSMNTSSNHYFSHKNTNNFKTNEYFSLSRFQKPSSKQHAENSHANYYESKSFNKTPLRSSSINLSKNRDFSLKSQKKRDQPSEKIDLPKLSPEEFLDNPSKEKLFKEHLQVLREKSESKAPITLFQKENLKKNSRKMKKAVKKYKIMSLMRSNSPKKTEASILEKMKSFIDSHHQKTNDFHKTSEKIISELTNLLQLLREMFVNPAVALSFLQTVKGFSNFSAFFLKKHSQEFDFQYTIREFREKDSKFWTEEVLKKGGLFADELKLFLKKKSLEFAEIQAKNLEKGLDGLKTKTFGFLESLKENNAKKYWREKNFLFNNLEFLRQTQIENYYKLDCVTGLEKSEKIVGKFENLKESTRIIAKSFDFICKKTGF